MEFGQYKTALLPARGESRPAELSISTERFRVAFCLRQKTGPGSKWSRDQDGEGVIKILRIYPARTTAVLREHEA